MKVKLLGKSHRDGISAKTGKPYNINSLHCVGSARNVEGQAVMVVTVNGAEHPYEELKIGGVCGGVRRYRGTGGFCSRPLHWHTQRWWWPLITRLPVGAEGGFPPLFRLGNEGDTT